MRDHPMLPGLTPTVFIMVNPMKLPSKQQREEGVACVTADDFRWEKAHIKSTSLLGAVFARQISVDAGALETVMFRDDSLSEAAASNVWVVKDGKVMGPPKDNLVLEGIRYGLMEEMCRSLGLPFELRRISRAEVLAADELLLSSATKEVLPITLLDGQPVGKRQARPHLCQAATPPTSRPYRSSQHERSQPEHAQGPARSGRTQRLADRVSVAVSHQGHGRQGGRAGARHHPDRPSV